MKKQGGVAPRYSEREVREAFAEWAETPPEFISRREMFWDRYVDRRDQLPEGTAEKRRIEGMGSRSIIEENEGEEVA